MTQKERARRNRQRRNRRIALFVATVVLTAVFAIGGTIAWLTDKTDPITNTFTAGDINITLTEGSDLDLKMVPGKTITKDPVVTVKGNSEACYLFVKVDKSTNFSDFMDYDMADGWNELEENSGIYYREVPASTADQVFGVIKGNEVTVKDSVTKEQLNALTDETLPTLTFTAYACQKHGFGTAADAWTKVGQ